MPVPDSNAITNDTSKNFLYSHKLARYGSILLFISCIIIYVTKQLSQLALFDAIIQAIAASLVAVGFSWLIPYAVNIISKFFRKKNLASQTFTGLWILSAIYALLSALL
jgi:hypothetical protein